MSLENYPNFLLNFSEQAVKVEEKLFYQFKSFRLYVEERQLINNGVSLSLTPKAFDVLAVLVEHNGHLVEKDELLKLVWVDSFVEEANITRIVHTLRKTLGEDENGNKFIETVAKKGYRFVAEVTEIHESVPQRNGNCEGESSHEVDFPQTIADEIPESKHQIQPAVANETATPDSVKPKHKARFILFGMGCLITLFLLFLLSYNLRQDSTVKPNKVKSIAVLPLTPVNTTKRDEIYEIGIADSLIYHLSSMKGIIVRPLSATRKYADVEQDPIAAGREQKVDYILASNYQIADGKIRITAQLFNVATGQIEETYKSEKDARNIFALQDAIAGEVGNLLLNRFTLTSNSTTARRGTTNEEAYRLYLQGKNLTMKRNVADAKKAVEYLEQAIRLDPNFALAYAQMAHAYRKSGSGGEGEYEKIKEFINKALELDPNLSEAYVARADGYLLNEWNFAAVEKDLAKAIELEPNNDTAHWLNALLLAYRGRFDEALAEIETAQTIDPGAVMYMFNRGRILYYARRYDEAITQYKQAIDLDEHFIQPHGWLVRAYEIKGDYAAAYQSFIKREERSPRKDRLESYKKAYETAGWMGVRRSLSESSEVNIFDLARLHALQGEKDAAFEYLNKAVEKREWHIITLIVEPAFDNLRDDPRFDELVRRVGLK